MNANIEPVQLPREYNATSHFVDRHLLEGRGDKTAFIDCNGPTSYAQLAERTNRAGNALQTLGAGMESRVMMCMLDTSDFPALFWGAIKIGAVPIPVNTLLTEKDYEYMLRDCRASILVVSAPLYEQFSSHLDSQPFVRHVVIAGGSSDDHPNLDTLIENATADLQSAPTTCDDAAFWLYTSGSTGTPKGAIHHQSDLVQTAELYGKQTLGMTEEDIVFSAAKLFFAYGLGNGMSFPLHVGATAVLLDQRPTPESVLQTLNDNPVSIFFGVPTLYSAILSDPANDRTAVSDALRLSVSAGEALPAEVGRSWEERFGTEILDGLGSTEMLHIFLSNRPGEVRYGTSGRAVPGYSLKIVDEDNQAVPDGEIGELLVDGPSSATSYWNQREKSLSTFEGRWTHSGDKYILDQEGYYCYCGRTDDMLKVSGIWVSPFEVESALLEEDRVLEAAVIGSDDGKGLIKPKAYVVLKPGHTPTAELEEELKAFVKENLALYKYPRWIEFIDDLPKTATGKIQRFKLREIDNPSQEA